MNKQLNTCRSIASGSIVFGGIIDSNIYYCINIQYLNLTPLQTLVRQQKLPVYCKCTVDEQIVWPLKDIWNVR